MVRQLSNARTALSTTMKATRMSVVPEPAESLRGRNEARPSRRASGAVAGGSPVAGAAPKFDLVMGFGMRLRGSAPARNPGERPPVGDREVRRDAHARSSLLPHYVTTP